MSPDTAPHAPEATTATLPPRGSDDIPGPGALELLRLLPELTTRPHEVIQELAARYGDVFILAYPLDHVVVLSNPDHIEYVLHHRHQFYDKQTARWRTLRQVWGQGLLTADGDQWRRQRQRMQPAFHQEALKTFANMVVDEALKIRDDWEATARAGGTRDVYKDMMRCALRAITRAAFGGDIEAHIDRLIHGLDDINAYVNPISAANLMNLPLGVRRWVSPGFGAYDRAMKDVQRVFNEIIARRLKTGPTQGDLLDMMMTARDEELSTAMTEQELRHEMMGILMAGHETTGIGTAWTWHWVSQNPDVERRLHEEIDTALQGRKPGFDDLPRLDYTRRVFQEGLRISPPVYGFDRRAREDDVIGGYRIPRGTGIVLSSWIMHHHPKYWDRPDVFDPERFTAAAVASRPQYAYFPFGGGPRRCVGMRFAVMEGQLILATLAQAFAVHAKPGHPVEREPRLNMPPRYGLQMSFTPRHA